MAARGLVNGRGPLRRSGRGFSFHIYIKRTGYTINTFNGIIKGNKDQDRLCEEYVEDHFCHEDGRFSEAS